jgi:GntR family transcriptional regulator/MocR family aminotransferase
LPQLAPRRFKKKGAAGPVQLDLPEPLEADLYPGLADGMLPLLGGLPDLRVAPVTALARAYRRALLGAPHTLDYQSEYGNHELRTALAGKLRETRGLTCSGDDILVTRGSQMALFLAASALLRPGDAVAVEVYGYRPAWRALSLAGAKLLPVPVDASGIRVDALEQLLATEKIRALYVTPHHQYPTTVTLTARRRIELLKLAARHRFAILEDDYDHEYHYWGRPILPLASADEAGVVVYIGTLSKVLFPGIRIGYVAASPPILDRMVRVRTYLDRQGDHAVEHSIASLIEDGTLASHVRRMRHLYEERRGVLLDALRRSLGDVLSFREPAGGLAVWARARGRVPVETWAARALDRGVVVQTAKRFSFDGNTRPYLRLGYARLDPGELRTAVSRLALALKDCG